MTNAPSVATSEPQSPIKNMRIRFWGVQGSCPMFPEPNEVEEYRWQVAQDSLQRVLRDLKSKGGNCSASIDQILALSENPAALNAHLRTLGAGNLPVYGGETTCVSVETSEGNVLLLDGGSGIRNASKHLIRNWADRPRTLYLLASHGHLDHRSGLPFCQFCFVRPPFDIRVYGTRSFLGAFDQRYGVFSRKLTPQMYYDDPIDYRMMAATFEAIEIPDLANPAETSWSVHGADQPIEIGTTSVTPFDVYHGPTRCLAYKIRHGDSAFVFCTDHELRRGTDPYDPRQHLSMAAEARLIEHCQDVDLAYFDGQYNLEEYYGKRGIGMTAAIPRIDWGHGCIEDVVSRAKKCRVKLALVGHHDPERSWQERIALDQRLAKDFGTGTPRIELAKSDMVVDI